MRKLAFILVPILAAVAAVWFYVVLRNDKGGIEFTLKKVERGPILSSVSSSGTLTAVVTVQVGSQVSGQIKELHADFNSQVRRGQVIAVIDPVTFDAKLRQSEAELAVTQANVEIQIAGLERAKAELENARSVAVASKAQTEKSEVALEDAKREFGRSRDLRKSRIIPESELDAAKAFYDQAVSQLRAVKAQEAAQNSLALSKEATLRMAGAQLLQARAQVKQKEAAVYQARVDLEHTVIRSPVDGVVIGRSVDIGQTVAASLQAPTLFTIAQDLHKMQVDTSVDEADIGRIREGQRTIFTVDAFPVREFTGRVVQIRKAPETLQNVVTYTVVVSAENPELQLLPGMTANVQILLEERRDVLKVPNQALRFTPPGDEGAPKAAADAGSQGPAARGSRDQEALLKRLTESLELTRDQQAGVREIFQEARRQILSLRSGDSASEGSRDEVKRIRQESRKAVAALLTPEQRLTYRQFLAERRAGPVSRGRVWVPGSEGRPLPVAVGTGISDGNFTEIVSGDLQPGQEVIVGTKPLNRRSPAQTPKKRLGF